MVTFNTRLYIPLVSSLLLELLFAVHDDSHEGVQRTMHCLHLKFHFPNMRRVILDYIHTCTMCQCYKYEHLHPTGLLMLLSVPMLVWADIGLDFVESLPHVGGKFMILMVVQ